MVNEPYPAGMLAKVVEWLTGWTEIACAVRAGGAPPPAVICTGCNAGAPTVTYVNQLKHNIVN